MAELSELLAGGRVRLLTLTGPGGSGKTRLAIALAEKLRARFLDGVHFVDLSLLPASEPDLVWHVVANSLQVQLRRRETLMDSIGSALSGRHILLVLDNFEHVLPAAKYLPPLLERHADFAVLATSREPLHSLWEHTYALRPLELPDTSNGATAAAIASSPAVTLFVERARAVHPRFQVDDGNAAAVAQLCTRLDGLPLAIELAAARSRVLSPSALLAHIGRQASLLGGGPRDAPARHRTLEATIAWSYDLLDEDDRVLFRHLGLFPGGSTPEAAMRVCAPRLATPDEADVLNRLASLADKSLLRAWPGHGSPTDEPRFGMFETLREFALAKLRGHDEEASGTERQLQYYLELAQRAESEIPGPQEVAWLDRLELEHANLRSAVHAAVASGRATQALRLCVSLGAFWRFRAHMDEALPWIEAGLARADSLDRALEARALALASRFAWSLGNHPQASDYIQHSIQLWRGLGDARGLANALNEYALQAGDSSRPAEARQALEEALGLFRSQGDMPGTTQTLHSLGFRAEERGELTAAEEFLNEALELRRALGFASGTARTLNGLGIVARGQGDLQRAEMLHTESLELYRDLGHDLGAAYALAYLARCAWLRGDTARALETARESVRISWQQRNPWVLSLDFGLFGIAAERAALAEQGARWLGVAERLLGGVEPSSATERAENAAAKAGARRALGDPVFEAAWRSGENVELAALVDEVLTSASMDGSTATARRPLGPLSAREMEVARLVARGLTNRQIADELIISKWTADNHVASILRKLDLVARSQVAGWLAQRGLL